MLLWVSFKQTVTFGFFWVVVLYCILVNGPWYDLSGMWVAPWLEDVFGYSNQAAGNTAIALTFGLIVGSLLIPPVSTLLRTRKWVLCVTATVAFAVSLIFLVLTPEHITYPLLYFLLIVIGATTNSMSSVAYPLVREYYSPTIAGTAVGCANTFTFLSSAAYQTMSSDLIKKKGFQGDSRDKYTLNGYRNGLWLVLVISWGLGAVVAALTKDTEFPPAKSESDDHSDKGHEVRDDDLDEV
jgi:sugar phosphate permease